MKIQSYLLTLIGMESWVMFWSSQSISVASQQNDFAYKLLTTEVDGFKILKTTEVKNTKQLALCDASLWKPRDPKFIRKDSIHTFFKLKSSL